MEVHLLVKVLLLHLYSFINLLNLSLLLHSLCRLPPHAKSCLKLENLIISFFEFLLKGLNTVVISETGCLRVIQEGLKLTNLAFNGKLFTLNETMIVHVCFLHTKTTALCALLHVRSGAFLLRLRFIAKPFLTILNKECFDFLFNFLAVFYLLSNTRNRVDSRLRV